jgi:hypothetical protein
MLKSIPPAKVFAKEIEMSEPVTGSAQDGYPSEDDIRSVYCVDEGRFARNVAQLYQRSSATERANILNRLLRAVTAASAASAVWTPITAGEAATLACATVEDLANESARRDPRVLDLFS